jgi:23S rRNA (guanine2445-N2)-methyltransferase / 23S rRNA (guanine2069-N7)-methyltransferase
MKQTEINAIFVTCPKGLHYILEKEIRELGGENLKPTPAGVFADVDSKGLYQVLLWSRIANRVILLLKEGKIDQADHVYDLAMSINWLQHFSETTTFAVDFIGTNEEINNSTFGALKIKDAIVDQFRTETGVRPSVDRTNPQVRISARLNRGRVSIGIDLSGESLHKRGYRSATGRAPLKENLAAGLLVLAGWSSKFTESSSFVDPMCGSGTLLIEAAMLATKKAANLDREVWGFSQWRLHDVGLWEDVKASAISQFEAGKQEFKGRIVGYDQDSRVVGRAWENIRQAGFSDFIHVEKRALQDFCLVENMEAGLLLTNPPYGERLGEVAELNSLYALLGQQFESHLISWKAGVFTGNLDLGRRVAWRSHKQYKLYNGAIESQLILFDLEKENRFKEAWVSPDEKILSSSNWKVTHPERAQMFGNRLKKNLKLLGKWAQKSNIDCYRLYDADMPEFAIAIDVYREVNGTQWLHVQEYAAPKSISESVSHERLSEALSVLGDLETGYFDVLPDQIILKRRARQKGVSQYEKNDSSDDFFTVQENDAQFQVNLKDYLDTGLFLDHRPIRTWVQKNSAGKRFLNLFCYTASVTVYAALGGAAETNSVDMSRTYINWAQRNFELNKLSLAKNKLIQDDCIEWLNRANNDFYDLIFLDPPSFSNSKRMQGVLDIQQDHASLIDLAMKCLNADGHLVFSNNLRKFKLDPELLSKYKVTDFTKQSIDKDFERNAKIHQCWIIEHV